MERGPPEAGLPVFRLPADAGVHGWRQQQRQEPDRGLDSLREDVSLAAGASIIRGKLVSRPVAEAQVLPYTPLEQAL